TFIAEFGQRRPLAEIDAARLRDLLTGRDTQSRGEGLLEEVRYRMNYLLHAIQDHKAGESATSIAARHGYEGRRLSNEIDRLADELGAQEDQNLAHRTRQ